MVYIELKCEACGGIFDGHPVKHRYRKPKYCPMCRQIKRNLWAVGNKRPLGELPIEFNGLVDDTGTEGVDEEDLW